MEKYKNFKESIEILSTFIKPKITKVIKDPERVDIWVFDFDNIPEGIDTEVFGAILDVVRFFEEVNGNRLSS